PRTPKPVPSTEIIINDIATYAVRRSHNVIGLPIGNGGVEAGPEIVIGQGNRDASGTALPDAHQPDAIESKIGDLIPVPVRNRSKIDWRFFVLADRLQPRPSVDLVEIRIGDLA